MKNSNDRRTRRLLPALAAVCLIALPVVALAEDWFGEAIYSTVPSEPHNFALGDLNGDGVDDVAYAASGYLTVLLNDGNGGFVSSGSYAPVGASASIGLLNGDAAPDIASHYLGSLKIYHNDGAGQFTLGGSLSLPYGGVCRLAVGDLDLDGRSDVIAESCGEVHIHWNSQSGLSEISTSYPCGLPPMYGACGPVYAEEVVIADATGDGLPDVVIVGNVPNGFCLPEELFRAVGILENLGGRAFTDSVSWVLVEPWGTYGWGEVGVGDFDEDGLPELSVLPSFTEPRVRLFFRESDGTYSEGDGISGYGAYEEAVGDLDQDGHLDLFLNGAGLTSRIYRGSGDGTFVATQVDMAPVRKCRLGHFDQNEGLDVVGFYGATMRVLPNILFLTSDVTEAAAPVPEEIRVVPTVLSHGVCTILAPAAESSVTAEFLVTDLQGRLVTTLSASRASSTHLRATWDGRDRAGRDVPTGWYWIRHGDSAARAGKVLWIR